MKLNDIINTYKNHQLFQVASLIWIVVLLVKIPI